METLMRIFTILIFLLFLGTQIFASGASRIKNNEIVVKFSPGQLAQIDIQRALSEGLTGVAAFDALQSTYNIASLKQRYPFAKTKDIYGEPMNLRGWFKVYFSDSVNVEEVVQAYKLITGVENAQTIGIHRIDVVTPNDPNFTGGDMWYLDQVSDHDVDAPEAWDVAMGNTSIIVADMDSGFRYYHKDLGGANASSSNPENSRGNMWTNSGEMGALSTNGIDDDGNGYIDDWIGWDFVTGNPNNFDVGDDYDVEDNDPRDHNGHGTHTAGTIGAITNNGYAVSSIAGGNGETSGVGNGVKIMGLRNGWNDILNLGFVGMDFSANAFIYARDNGAHIASCSWGSSNTGGLEDAINYFLYGTTTPSGGEPQLGLIFKAAGNDDNEDSDYMLDRTDVIGVASTDQNDVKSDFSTYGTFVDISAPGTDIMSTYHDNSDAANDYVASVSGTSMATPCMASVAALVWSHNNALTPGEVEQILYDTADDISGIPGNAAYAGKLGAGRVNAFAAIQAADQALPVELASFSASVNDGNVILNWNTASELENLGFEVLRSKRENDGYIKLADFEDSEELKGLGTSSFGKDYSFIDYTALGENTYWYKIVDVDFNGVPTEHGPISITVNYKKDIAIEKGVFPKEFSLKQNFPNPFNPTTVFKLNIPKLQNESTQLSVNIFDLLGKKVKTLYDGQIEAGVYTFQWNGLDQSGKAMPSGMYIYSVNSAEFSQANKMILMK
ncbi:MAG: T9SS C-terminal target domain-containing protein [Calditrichaeota bacterium]|nr:MAG: T9SS C-terminal target domain-containing protein [Calditrichota bacterium]